MLQLRISNILLKEKLASCINIIPGVHSMYHWKGEIARDNEVLMMIKTKKNMFDQIVSMVKLNHPYEVPEVIAVPIQHGSKDYLDWVSNSVKSVENEKEKSTNGNTRGSTNQNTSGSTNVQTVVHTMKKMKKEILKFLFLDLKNNKQSLTNFYKILNKEYICGEIHKNLLLNPDEKSSFLYFEIRQNDVILGFKDTNNQLYQKLVNIKDKKIFGQHKTKNEENIANLIKDIKNYSYIQGGALVSFHKKLLKDFITLQLENFKEIGE
ncbi:conserved Plasmodium protein, unknown function [Plasmodium malariae]|uniref:Uncharacterized protein n=2 Tax=Plasmodium malariae TaxID=5858 RepID=A0A1A8WHY1_PLAMA|nr:conserved Plasmodium protein, unknown function [Plasmodium malariae]